VTEDQIAWCRLPR